MQSSATYVFGASQIFAAALTQPPVQTILPIESVVAKPPGFFEQTTVPMLLLIHCPYPQTGFPILSLAIPPFGGAHTELPILSFRHPACAERSKLKKHRPKIVMVNSLRIYFYSKLSVVEIKPHSSTPIYSQFA
jgi:hypothetical protein